MGLLAKPEKCISSVTTISFLLHGLSFAWSCFGIYKDRTHYIVPNFSEYGGRAQYLTMITAYLNLICNGIAFAIDLLQTLTGALESPASRKSNDTGGTTSFLIKVRDDLMSFWVFVMSTFVVLMYWGIVLVDLDGLHPPEHRKIMPLFGWYNQYLHTLPLFIAFIQIININYQYCGIPKAILFTASLGIAYFCWIVHLAEVKGYWAYSFLEKMNRVEFGAFIVFSHVVFFCIYLIGRILSTKIWNKGYKEKMLKRKVK